MKAAAYGNWLTWAMFIAIGLNCGWGWALMYVIFWEAITNEIYRQRGGEDI